MNVNIKRKISVLLTSMASVKNLIDIENCDFGSKNEDILFLYRNNIMHMSRLHLSSIISFPIFDIYTYNDY